MRGEKKNIYIYIYVCVCVCVCVCMYIYIHIAISWHIQADYLRGEGEKDIRESESFFSYSLKYFLTDRL